MYVSTYLTGGYMDNAQVAAALAARQREGVEAGELARRRAVRENAIAGLFPDLAPRRQPKEAAHG